MWTTSCLKQANKSPDFLNLGFPYFQLCTQFVPNLFSLHTYNSVLLWLLDLPSVLKLRPQLDLSWRDTNKIVGVLRCLLRLQ